ncbi:uncharacterized protein [Haliotis cracherodii]
MVLHYINLFTPSQSPRSSRLWDTARTVCLMTPFIYMFPIDMMKYHAIAIWSMANCSTQDGRIAMLLVEVLLWVLPVRAWFGWYNICICLPGLWSVITLVATEPRSTHHSVEPGKESTAGTESNKKDEIAEKSHDIDNVRQAVHSNHTKRDDSSDFQNSARKNKDSLHRIDVTGVSGGIADEVFASAFQNSTRNEDAQTRLVVTGVSGGIVGKAFAAGRDINYEPTIRDNVVTGRGNISENVQQAIQNPLSASGRLSETDSDDASEKQQDITNRTVITNNTVKQDHTSVTDSSLSNTQMANITITANPDLSCLDRTGSGATRDSTVSATDEDCDAKPRNVTPETKKDNVRRTRRQGVNKTVEETNPSREFIQINAKQDEILEIIKAVTPKEIHSLLKDAKREASEASSAIATLKDVVASNVHVVDEMDHLRSKFAELNTVADTLKEAKNEADAASSTVATMKQEVASTSRQVVDEIEELRSKFTELNRVTDTIKEAKREASEASSTVATMKQEVASTSRQVVDEMVELRSKFTELNRVTDTIKEAKREASEASSTVATMKQEMASTSRQVVDEMEELRSKLAELTTVVDALKKNVDTVPDAGAQITTYGIDSKQHDTEAKEKFKKTGRTPIMLAARVGDKNEFDRLIQTPGIDLSVSDKQSNNLLHIACLGGNSDIVSDLLSREMDINARGQYGRTPLMLAAQKGHTPLINLLIRHGVNSKLVDRDGNSAIHMACLGAELNVMKYLVEKEGFDVNEKGKNGMTPVMIAAEKSYEDIVRYLVEKNCDLNSLDTDGRNCRSYASQSGNERIVAYITSRLQQLTFYDRSDKMFNG